MISSVGSGPDLNCTEWGQNWTPIEGQFWMPIDTRRRSTGWAAYFDRICKGEEPLRVQAFGTEAAMESFDEGIIGGFAWSGEVQDDAALIGPEVHVA